jgi:hypothetical protein
MPFYQGYAPGMPGVGPTTYSRGRMIWAGLAGIQYLPVGGMIASALSRDPDNYEASTNYGNETEPETPPTTAALSNIPALPGALGQTAPTAYVASPYAGILRAGVLMGRITSTPTVVLCGTTSTAYKGCYRPSILGVTTATMANSATSVTVNAACYAEVARLYALGITTFKVIGCQSGTLGTLVSGDIVLSTPFLTPGTLTLTFSASTNSPTQTIAAGAFVCPADGSQYPVSFVDEQFGLNILDNFGVGLTAGGMTSAGVSSPISVAPFPRVPLSGGMVNALNIVNYPASTMLAQIAWLKGNLNSGGAIGLTATNYGGKFNFTDDYGL